VSLQQRVSFLNQQMSKLPKWRARFSSPAGRAHVNSISQTLAALRQQPQIDIRQAWDIMACYRRIVVLLVAVVLLNGFACRAVTPLSPEQAVALEARRERARQDPNVGISVSGVIPELPDPANPIAPTGLLAWVCENENNRNFRWHALSGRPPADREALARVM